MLDLLFVLLYLNLCALVCMTALCNTLLAQLALLLPYPIHIEDSLGVLHGGSLNENSITLACCPLEYTAPPLSVIAMFFLKVELFTINISGGWGSLALLKLKCSLGVCIRVEIRVIYQFV